jgi:glycosyltransferase involved in cell wall biosynthesis
MHILVLADRFTPEVTAVSVRTHAHAKFWLEQGHEVTVVTCAPNFPQGKVFEGYENKLYQEEFVDGIRVIRIGTYMSANEGMFKRTLDYLSFTFSAIFQCGRFPDYDVMIATSPPIFVAMAGSIIGWLTRKPWVFEVRDLWPASIAAVGASKSPLLALVEKYELFLYRHAARVIVLTHSFKRDLTERGIDPDKVFVVTNGIEVEKFQRPDDVSAARTDIGVDPDLFLAGYIGTTGMAHGLETLLEAADLCRDEPNIRFLIMGEGAKRAELEARAAEMRLSNLIFKDFVPHDQVVNYLSAMDMSIVHLKPDPVFKTVIPSKIFEAMALGVPSIHAVEGESAEIVEQAGAGVCVPSGDAQAIAEQAIRLSKDPEALRRMGEAGQRVARTQYDRRTLANEIIKVIEPLADAPDRAGAPSK